MALRIRIQIVLLHEAGWGAHRIAGSLRCVPATAVRVVRRFLAFGEQGLLDGRRDNGQLKVDDDLRQALAELVAASPKQHGWPRRWAVIEGRKHDRSTTENRRQSQSQRKQGFIEHGRGFDSRRLHHLTSGQPPFNVQAG